MITALLLSHALLAGAAASAPTAGELDWVPRAHMTPSHQADLLWFEKGAYIAPPRAAGNEVGPVTAVADEATQVIEDYVDLRGDVVIERGQRLIETPRLYYDQGTELAELKGPVVMRDRGLLLTGEQGTANLFDGSGTLTGSSFLLHDFALRGQAARIERRPNTILRLEEATLTRCEPANNSWLLSSSRVTLDPVTARGEARDVVIRVTDVPVFYSPWLSFPLDTSRQSGLLTPSAGYDSESGTELVIPWYFNIAPQVDATYELQSLWQRGILHDGQLRFLLGPTANEINAGFLRNDELFDPSTVVDEDADTRDFKKQDRWYINLRHDGNYGNGWHSAIDYNAVSDDDYLTDLDGRIGGSELNRYATTVGTNVTDRRTPALDRVGRLSWRGRHWHHSLLLQGFQVIDPNGSEQYQKLPEFTSTFADDIGPLAIDLDLEYARFDKDTAGISGVNAIVGDRVVIDTGVSFRRARSWGYIEPAMGVIWRRYDLDDVPAGFTDTPTSTIPRFSLDTGLIFDRFFSAGGHEWQQTLEPRLQYLYVEAEAQDELPQFDARPASTGYATIFRTDRYPGRDRIGDANRIGLGITTRLLRRDTGTERLTFSLGQMHHFRDRTVQFRTQAGEDPTRDASPLFVEGRLNFGRGLTMTGSYEWEPDVNRSNRGTLSIAYHSDDSRRIFNLSYVVASPLVERINRFGSEEESDLSFIWPLGQHLSAVGRWNFSWDRNQTLESFAGLEYQNCCIKTRLVFRRFLEAPRDVTFVREDPASGGVIAETRTLTPADTGIFVEFQFKGLATLGRRLDMLLDRGIPGYRQREDRIKQ